MINWACFALMILLGGSIYQIYTKEQKIKYLTKQNDELKKQLRQ